MTALPDCRIGLLLEQRISQAFATAEERGHRAAIICLDLDRFKLVNDWYGHAVGDECLKCVGTMLTRRLRGMDTVARTGGEEFTIVLGEVESVASAGIVAKALLQVLRFSDRGRGSTRSSWGPVWESLSTPDHGTDSAELAKGADTAMYRAKRAGGNRHVLAVLGCQHSSRRERRHRDAYACDVAGRSISPTLSVAVLP